jgi:hypothetical protein
MSVAEWDERFPLPDPNELDDAAYVEAILSELKELLETLERRHLRCAAGEPDSTEDAPFVRWICGRLRRLLSLRLGEIVHVTGQGDADARRFWGVEFQDFVDALAFNAHYPPEPEVLGLIRGRVRFLGSLAAVLRGGRQRKPAPSHDRFGNTPPPEAEPARPEAAAEEGEAGESGAPAGATAKSPDGEPICPVELGRMEDPVRINGAEYERLRYTQYRVVEALCKAWPRALSKPELERNSGSGDAVKVLKRLCEKFPHWKEVVAVAGQKGGGYMFKTANRGH